MELGYATRAAGDQAAIFASRVAFFGSGGVWRVTQAACPSPGNRERGDSVPFNAAHGARLTRREIFAEHPDTRTGRPTARRDANQVDDARVRLRRRWFPSIVRIHKPSLRESPACLGGRVANGRRQRLGVPRAFHVLWESLAGLSGSGAQTGGTGKRLAGLSRTAKERVGTVRED